MAAIGELIHYYYYLCRKLNKIKKFKCTLVLGMQQESKKTNW